MSIFGDAWDAITGKNKANGGQDVNPYQVDPNAYQYGGRPGGAQAQADKYGNWANGYVTEGGADFRRGSGYLNDQEAARQQQQDALGLAAQRAHGQNLISSQITQQQQARAAAEQQGIQNSARGPAALAMAQQNAAAATGQANAQLGAQGAIAGAQEQLANQQAYAQQAAGIRAGDLGAVGAAGSLGAQQGQLGLGFSGLENNVQQAQLTAQMNQQAQNSANYNAAKGLNAQVGAGNAGGMQRGVFGLLGAASSGAGALGGGAAAAHGGAVHGAKPYLVGEQGPELVVPKKDGWVLTAQQTAALLGAPPTQQQMAHMHGLAGMRDAGGPFYAQPAPTWGNATTQEATDARLAEEGAAWNAAQQQQMLDYKYGGQAAKDIEARDRARLAGYEKARAVGAFDNVPQTAEEAADERRARYSVGAGKVAEQKDEKQAKKAAQEYTKGQKLGNALSAVGGGFSKTASGIDATQIGGTYQAPAMIALPSYSPRAAGGPITDPGGESAGELGMGGPGGLVSGTIGHENQLVGGAVHGKSPIAGALAGMGKGFSSMDVPVAPIESSYVAPEMMALPRAEGGEVLALSEPQGKQLHMSDSGRAFLATPDMTTGASVSGAAPRFSAPAAVVVEQPSKKAARKMTDEEMLAEADRMLAATRAQKDAQLSMGPAVGGGQPPMWLVDYMAGRAYGGMIHAREEGGPLAAITSHVRRALHSIAASASEATEPEPIAVARKEPRSAETAHGVFRGVGNDRDNSPGLVREPVTSTMINTSGPKEYPEKVSRARDDNEARAYGGAMLASRRKR